MMHSYSTSTNVLDGANVNLAAIEKELLLWHQRLSHASISWLQPLMRTKKWLKDHTSPACLHQGPFLPCKIKRTASCSTTGMRCAACLAAKASTRSAGARHESHATPTQSTLEKLSRRVNGEHQKKLKRGDLMPGDCVSTDNYMSAVEGRLEHTFEREKQGYTCGTIFVDNATGKVFNYCQVSNDATSTIESKCKLEHIARAAGFSIKKYHSDNGTFASDEFQSDCDKKEQTFDYSGVEAKHQNVVAERNIKTVSSWGRANTLHLAYHWPARAKLSLWPLAIAYTV